MNRIQLKKGLHLLLQGQEYSVEERLLNGEVHLKNLLTNTSSKLKETVLTQLLFKGELQFGSTVIPVVDTTDSVIVKSLTILG